MLFFINDEINWQKTQAWAYAGFNLEDGGRPNIPWKTGTFSLSIGGEIENFTGKNPKTQVGLFEKILQSCQKFEEAKNVLKSEIVSTNLEGVPARKGLTGYVAT